MQLKQGTTLQGGKYEILSTLGQGGFGITYEALQVGLGRKVAVKEFFMKDCCERVLSTSHVSVGTGSQRELVTKFRDKFLREAKMIAGLDNHHIVKIHDVFEENGTAYYVMENLPGGSLADKVKKDGPLSEAQAEKYIRQVADALAYIHERNTVHLDVKPSNILLNAKGEAVLIDFGISKHYDKSGEQTSSTPVGISKGYAPMEQGRDGDVSQFGPSTDIYALGATLYHLVSGQVPPEATIVVENRGVERPAGISARMWNVISNAMQPIRTDRPQSIAEFLQLFDEAPASEKEDSDETVVVTKKEYRKDAEKKPSKTWLWAVLGVVAIAAIVLAVVLGKNRPANKPNNDDIVSVSIIADGNNAYTYHVNGSQEPIPFDSLEEKFIDLLSQSDDPTVRINYDQGVPEREVTKIMSIAKRNHFKVVLENNPREEQPIDVVSVASITLSESSLDIEKGKSIKLLATITPSNSTDATVHWESNDEQIAVVTEVGEVTAKKVGTATIVASCGGQEAYCEVTVKEKPTPKTGYDNGHEWVDLGLPSGTKWATCNVGATRPTEDGDYFAWGETSTKSSYSSMVGLKYFVNGADYRFSKYVPSNKPDYWGGDGSPDNKTRLDLIDDAARANWGGKWRIPTKTQWQELKNKCTWSLTENGCKVTGPSGLSIFLPNSKDLTGSAVPAKGGSYWSSTLGTEAPHCAWYLSFNSERCYPMDYNFRWNGYSVRPVTK